MLLLSSLANCIVQASGTRVIRVCPAVKWEYWQSPSLGGYLHSQGLGTARPGIKLSVSHC